MAKRALQGDFSGLNLTAKEANFVIEFTKDFAPRRAAEASGFGADYGYKLRDQENICAAVDHILSKRLDASHIDAEWVLLEAVDNHLIARQAGNISASNTALGLVAKHVMVDAFAADKVTVTDDKEVMERLIRGRQRLSAVDEPNEVSFL